MKNITDWQNAVGTQVNWVLRLDKEGAAQFSIKQRDKKINIALTPNDAIPLLQPLLEKYSEWFEHTAAKIESDFLEVKEGIVLWLQDKYRITPTLKAFSKWFMLNRLNPATIGIEGGYDKATGDLLPNVKIRFNFSNINETHSPEVLESDLVEFCHWKNNQLSKIDQNITAVNEIQQSIEQLKSKAINETADLFKGRYKYEPEYNTLLEELNRSFDYYGIKHEIDRNSSYIRAGRIKELEKEIHGYLDTCQREKGKIIVNEGNVVSNCKPPRMALDYCKYTFWELLHTAQLENLQDKIVSEHDMKTNAQKQLKISECSDEYLLDVGVLAKVCKTFNDVIWEDAKESKFLAVFSVGSPYTLNIKQKQKFYALLKCMYDMYKRNGGTLGQSEWVKPLIDKHKLSLSSFDNIGNKLFNKDRKTPIEKAFINSLKAILPIDEK